MRIVALFIIFVASAASSYSPTANHPPTRPPIIQQEQEPFLLVTMSVSNAVSEEQMRRQELLLYFTYSGLQPVLWASKVQSEDKKTLRLIFINAVIHPGLETGYKEHMLGRLIQTIEVNLNSKELVIEFNHPMNFMTFTNGEGVVGFIFVSNFLEDQIM